MFAQVCCDFLERIDPDELLPFVAIVGGLTFAVLVVLITSFRTVVVARAKEATRRELAAYVAEGSMTPDQAVAMMDAGKEPPAA